jgi:hypothetical protein
MELPAEHLVTGRRIYVHERSFERLAAAGPDEFAAVNRLLTESWIFRVAIHHIGSDRLVGFLSRNEEDVIVDEVRNRFRSACSPVLGAISFRSPSDTVPLLNSGESLHATCFDSGYYTFATDSASACRMYDDTLPLRSLYSACSRGAGDPDLTMVRGHRLVWSGSVPPPALEASHPVERLAPAALERLHLAVDAGRRQAERRLIGRFG